MGIEKLITIALSLVILAASAGNLPRMLNSIRAAQLQLIKQSQASGWGQAIFISRD